MKKYFFNVASITKKGTPKGSFLKEDSQSEPGMTFVIT